MTTTKILAFAGSTRKDSFNRKLIQTSANYAADNGIAITVVELEEYPMPLYNQDLEKNEGFPDSVKKLKTLFLQHQGLLLASPEYNSSITPLLKNTIDWVSRKESENEPGLAAYQGKVAGILSASAGALGGMRSLNHLRDILGNIGVVVIPNQLAISKADEAFTTELRLKDEKKASSLIKLLQSLSKTTEALHAK